MTYKCQLCGYDGPLSDPCPRCEPIADSDPAAFLPAMMHRLRATRVQLLTDDALRRVLVEKEARILSLEASLDLSREQYQMADRERRQFQNSAMRYASAKLPETIEKVRHAHMDHIITLDGSAALTPADERCEGLLEAIQAMVADAVSSL